MGEQQYKKWVCLVCGWIYDEVKGDASEGFAPGTRWQDIPDDWVCPDCGVSKADFVMVELSAKPKKIMVRTKFTAPVVIVGSGYAGLSQARKLREISADIPILLICQDGGEEYPKPSLSSALSHHKSADDLVRLPADELATTLNIDVMVNTEVVDISPIHKNVTTVAGKVINYTKLVLALGSSPNKPNIDGDAVDEIMQINHLTDYRVFRQRLDKAQHILIIGSGLIGCEFANDLCCYAKDNAINISLVGHDSYPMATMIPDQAGDMLRQSLAINWQFNATVITLNHDNGQLSAVLDNGEVIKSDLVLCAIGIKAHSALAQKVKLKTDKAIVVNANMQTSNQHIYAIGDCAQTPEGVRAFIAPIHHQVETTALNIVGQKSVLDYPPMPVKVKVAVGLTFLMPPQGAKVRWTISHSVDSLKAITHSRKGRINGFVLMGTAQNELKEVLKKTHTHR